jgi:hypothetical protein
MTPNHAQNSQIGSLCKQDWPYAQPALWSILAEAARFQNHKIMPGVKIEPKVSIALPGGCHVVRLGLLARKNVINRTGGRRLCQRA